MEEMLNQEIPPCRECRFYKPIDGVLVGFTSKRQMSRFLKLRVVDGEIIHGLLGSVQKARGKYYYNGRRISKEVGEYNLHVKEESEEANE